MNREHVAGIMQDAGEALDLEYVTAQGDPKMWTLIPDDRTLVMVEYWDARGLVQLSLELVAVPGEMQKERYELLLLANSLGMLEDGYRMALSAPNGSVIISVEIGAQLLTVETLGKLLEGLRKRGLRWANVLRRDGRAEGQHALPQDDMASIRI